MQGVSTQNPIKPIYCPRPIILCDQWSVREGWVEFGGVALHIALGPLNPPKLGDFEFVVK
jgi:hypothetical protein